MTTWLKSVNKEMWEISQRSLGLHSVFANIVYMERKQEWALEKGIFHDKTLELVHTNLCGPMRTKGINGEL